MHGSSMLGRLPESQLPSDYVPLLRLLIFTGVALFGFALAWHFGLIRLMLASDTTHISAVICVLYIAVSLHCLTQTVTVSRELNSGHRAYALVTGGGAKFAVDGGDVTVGDGVRLPRGHVASHIRNLVLKAGLHGTIVGFILMLAPIAGLDAADRASVKSSMGLMSDGMAVAMYTTLTGLIGSILVQTDRKS